MISIKKASDEIYLLTFNRTVFYDSSIYYEIKKINIIEEKVYIELFNLETSVNKIGFLIETFKRINYERDTSSLFDLLLKVSIYAKLYTCSRIPYSKVYDHINTENYYKEFSSHFEYRISTENWRIEGKSSPELLEKLNCELEIYQRSLI